MRKWSDRVTTRHGQARHAALSETSTVIIIHTSLCFFPFLSFIMFFFSPNKAHASLLPISPFGQFPISPCYTRVCWCFVREVSTGDDGDNKHELRERIASTFC
ncbi:hypothetical protein GHT06_013319 [Daphnia sinensis]|uniref:Transmembrane protein n=1 Tax=Daphnia sinensis TaxID=1820382 RepID=A0AAD5KX41_9CRUS|nr:hypothetical protein GHT06_013319 [Daphnia sinensis]